MVATLPRVKRGTAFSIVIGILSDRAKSLDVPRGRMPSTAWVFAM